MLVPGSPSCDLVFAGLSAWPAAGREVYAGGLGVAAGAHFNTAAALRRLNVRVALVAAVGDDVWGDLVLRDVRAERLPEEHVRVLTGVSTPVSAALNFAGDRGFVTHAPAYETIVADVVSRARELLSAGRVAHVHGDLSTSTRTLLDAARAAGSTYSVDAHEAGPWLAESRVRALVADVDLLFANEDEAIAMTGVSDWRAALLALAREVPHVVLKRGAAGAACAVAGDVWEAPALPATVVDATGAGDCFAAGYLWALRRGRPPAACLEAGHRCGAAAVGAMGGFRGAPTEDDLAAAP